MPAIPPEFAHALETERHRLVGLCAVVTGEPRIAEDLAQETLLEAWRHVDRLIEPTGVSAWLSAIARNVCLRWLRRHGRDTAHLAGSLDDLAADRGFAEPDLEVELEHAELVRLLDRALALLPPETRAALIAHYVEDLPQTQIARNLGLTEGAVAMRLHRGKVALRRVLATDLRPDAEAFGLVHDGDGWGDTQLWCPICGRQRLRGRLNRSTGEFILRCPVCNDTGDLALSRAEMPLLHRSGQSPRAAAARLRDWLQERYWSPPQGRLVRCSRCERLLPPTIAPSPWPFAPQVRYALDTTCPDCGTQNRMWLSALAFGLPEGHAFWRSHPRMRVLPEQDVIWEGQPAVRIGFESVTSSASLEVLILRDAAGTWLRPHDPTNDL